MPAAPPQADRRRAPGSSSRYRQPSSLAVIRGGASLQVWECCGAPGPGTQNEPSHWPPGAPSRGVFAPLLPTHLASVSCSCPAPRPLSCPLPTRARNQPWSPLLTLPCLLPGLSKDVPTGGLRAQASLSCQCSTGLRSLGLPSTTGCPQCRDSQNGQNKTDGGRGPYPITGKRQGQRRHVKKHPFCENVSWESNRGRLCGQFASEFGGQASIRHILNRSLVSPQT